MRRRPQNQTHQWCTKFLQGPYLSYGPRTNHLHEKMDQRKTGKVIHLRLEIPLAVPDFSNQKEKRRLPSNTRLPKAKLIYCPRQNPFTTNPRPNQPTSQKDPIYQIRHSHEVWQHLDKRRWSTKSCLHHTPRTIWAHGNELWTTKCTRNLHENDE